MPPEGECVGRPTGIRKEWLPTLPSPPAMAGSMGHDDRDICLARVKRSAFLHEKPIDHMVPVNQFDGV